MSKASAWLVSRDWLQGLSGRTRTALRRLPELLARPAVIPRWLLGARAAQITLVACLLILLFVFPPVRDAVLQRVFPPEQVSRDRMLGLVKETTYEPNPLFDPARWVFTWTAWLGSSGLVLLLLVLRIPEELGDAAPAENRARTAAAPSPPALESAPTVADPPEPAAETIPDSVGSVVALPPPGESAIREHGVIAGRYHIEKEVGRGGMGRVYRAHDDVLDRAVAIKALPRHLSAHESSVARFRQEARALARLKHPHIVHVYDLVEQDGLFYMVLELVDGGHLAAYIARAGRLQLPEVARVGSEIADALGFSHARGIVHRDLKPLNVLLTEEAHAVKVTDFGLAKLAESTMHTVEGSVLGSPRYMSPEQADGRPADARSDLYALGVILYELVTGRVPFEGETASVLVQHLTKAPTPPRSLPESLDVPTALDSLILSLLEKRPEDRPAGMDAVRDTLTGLL